MYQRVTTHVIKVGVWHDNMNKNLSLGDMVERIIRYYTTSFPSFIDNKAEDFILNYFMNKHLIHKHVLKSSQISV